MAIINNLFPPIIAAYMPAFVMDSEEGCKIYFSISTLNNYSEVGHIQLTCANLITNQNALYGSGEPEEEKTPWKNKIRFYTLSEVEYDGDRGSYFVRLTNKDIEGDFKNLAYKVQIRFGSTTNFEDQASWLTSNLMSFSEWSSVCIIKAIPQPEFSVVGFVEGEDIETVLATSSIMCVGNYFCEDPSETLQSYRFRIFEDGVLLEDSGIISTPVNAGSDTNTTIEDSQQVIQYIVRHVLNEDSSYILEWYYITKNFYEATGTYNFSILQNEMFPLNITLIIQPDEENGRNKISMTSTGTVIGNLAIRRTSSKDNFELWEDIKIIQIVDNLVELDLYDYIIESGVWYKYGVQRISNRNERGAITIGKYGYLKYDHEDSELIVTDDEEIINNFKSCFLYSSGIQLKLEFNTRVSSFKTTVLETKTDTIGSRYPFIRRNGNVYYKEFPISALITSICNDNDLFATAEEVLGGKRSAALFEAFNEKHNIISMYDYNYEREFRNSVYKFLEDGGNKLFKSPTEGNLAVRLMNITFSPEESLGRLIYTLDCNAYEQGDVLISTLVNLGILSDENFDVDLNVRKVVNSIGQIFGTITMREELIARIRREYSKNEFGYAYTVGDIISININAPAGSMFNINNQEVVMGDTEIYEYNDGPITSLYFYMSSNDSFLEDGVSPTTDIIVNFIYKQLIQEDTSEYFTSAYNYRVVGDVYQTFEKEQDIAKLIYNRYYDRQTLFKIELLSIEKIRIEALDPAIELPNGTVIYKKPEFKINNIKTPFRMNDTNIYQLQRGIIDIKKLYFTEKTTAKVDYIARIRRGIY